MTFTHSVCVLGTCGDEMYVCIGDMCMGICVYGDVCMGGYMYVYGDVCMGDCVRGCVYGGMCTGMCVWGYVYGDVCVWGCGDVCMVVCVRCVYGDGDVECVSAQVCKVLILTSCFQLYSSLL